MTQPLLLDTCAALWIVAGAPVAKAAMQALEETAKQDVAVKISPITAWEIGLLARKGRFRSSLSPQRWFDQLLGLPGVELCELSPEVLIASSFLPGTFHGDPADRILAATAREHRYRVMTRDQALLQYAADGHLAALAC
jgi:PIN domain nuclease of toxin-antitoxin system